MLNFVKVITLKEQYFYVSKRLGVRQPHVQLASAPHRSGGYGTMPILDFEFVILNRRAFGSRLPGRTYVAPTEVGYRFGFNGMQRDDEIKGPGNSLDFGARMYDSRLGRWMSVDPLQVKFPSLSPYNGMANNPIIFVDPDGRDIKFAIWVNDGDGNWNKKIVTYKDLNPKLQQALHAYAQTNEGREFLAQFAKKGDKIGNVLFNEGKYSNHVLEIEEFDQYGSPYGTSSFRQKDGKAIFNIKINSRRESEDNNSESLAVTLGHESFIHLDNYIKPVVDAVEKKDKSKFQKLSEKWKNSANERRGGPDHDAYRDGKRPRMNQFNAQLKNILSPSRVSKAVKSHDEKY